MKTEAIERCIEYYSTGCQLSQNVTLEARAELTALEADSRRLEQLEAMLSEEKTRIWTYKSPGSKAKWIIDREVRREGSTLRAAIDAAMESEK